jgi:hypothetical protein
MLPYSYKSLMAIRLDQFPDEAPQAKRKYPWDEWSDGSVWEIKRGEDYDVATENMRVNLHMKADALARKVKTRKFSDERGEGLIFQFIQSEDEERLQMQTAADPTGTATALDQLYEDTVGIYDRAREEVTIERKDGRTQKYAPTRFKQQIDKGHEEGLLVPAVARIIRRPTLGFGHLENAERPDLMLETLVLDTEKPYHRLFSDETVRIARERMDDYEKRH